MNIKTLKATFAIFILAPVLFISSIVSPNPVHSQPVFSDDFIPIGIPPLSKRTAILSFPLSVYPFVNAGQGSVVPPRTFQELQSIMVIIEDRTEGKDTLSINEDFLPLTASALSSGLSLYKESGARRGGFNFRIGDQNSDTPVDLAGPPTVQQDPANPRRFFVTFRPIVGSAKLSLFQDQFPDFYIVAQTSLEILHGDRFEVSIPQNGITIRDSGGPLIDNTVFEERFPGPSFESLNPSFAQPAIFEGDLFELFSIVNETDNTNRIDASSEPTTIMGLEMVGRQDQGYFLSEVSVNWIGLNLGQISRLMANRTQADYSGARIAGALAASQAGVLSQVNLFPSFFYSPWFYNYPTDPETGEPLVSTIETPFGPLEYPLTAPLDANGFPLPAFTVGMDDLNSHVTSYTPSGPRLPFIGIDALTPDTVSQDILLPLSSSSAGGVFLYRELGGSKNKYDAGVDQIIKLDPNGFTVETFGITPDEVQDPNSPLSEVLRRLVPGVVNEGPGIDTVNFLFGDTNLAADLLGVFEIPDAVDGMRPPYGSLACYEDPDCLFFDLMINVLKPYLGLTEGQIRYLAEYTEENGITNMEELFGFPIVQGFRFVMPVSRDNALSNIIVPSSRIAANAGPEIFVGIRTSDKLRALDSFIPFIRPKDLSVGTNVQNYTQNIDENVTFMDSVASIGAGRPNSAETFTMIGRPKPRFQFEDLTQPGPDPIQANRNNILFDSSLSAPPKAVIGIDAIDFGQNPNRVQNSVTIQQDNFDVFFDESAVLGEAQIEFLPTQSTPVFDPLIFNVIPFSLNVDLPFSRIITQHSVAFYMEDDTPSGNGFDDDGDGLVDEEYYNLIDDDGDGLIDEDLGDGTPAGTNGEYDSFDQFLPPFGDNRGSPLAFQQSQYVFPPNDLAKYQPYVDAISDPNNPFVLVDGGMIPLSNFDGSWFTELDFSALNYELYTMSRLQIFPGRGQRLPITPLAAPEFDPPLLNQGTFSPTLQPYTGLMDLVKAIGLPDSIPDDLVVAHPDSPDDEVFLITLTADADTDIPIIGDPDGDLRRTILLSLAAALRIPNPQLGFVRVGSTPLITQVGGPNGSDPSGDSQVGGSIYQNGFFVEVANTDAINDYVADIIDQLNDAIESAAELQADFEQEIQDIMDDAASQDPPEPPDFSDLELPEPVEISFTHPYDALGIQDFLENNDGVYETNYQFHVQIPDENFGPLGGNDFYVVLRAGDTAQTGDSFRVRISSGQRNRQFTFADPDDGTIQTVDAPDRGISYLSYVNTDSTVGLPAFPNVSKNQITTGPIIVRSANVPPSISFFAPGPQQNIASAELTYDILFIADDPDNVATIRLFVDVDNLNFDGTFIPGSQLREGFDNGFTLDLRRDIPNFDPTRPYYIYAEISDGVNAPVVTYADGPIIALPTGGDGDGGGDGGGGGINVEGDVANELDYIKLTNDGRIFSLGEMPRFDDVNVSARTTDTEKTTNNTGAIVVQEDGKVLGSGTIGIFQRRLQPNGEVTFSPQETVFVSNQMSGAQTIIAPTPDQITIDFARDIEVDFVNGAIYILDGDGDMLYLGNANSQLRPPAIDIDLYRDMELSPDGSTLYFLSGNGIFSTVGPNRVGDWSNLITEDKYRDLELVLDGQSVAGILVVDDDGIVTAIGSSSRATNLVNLSRDVSLDAGTVRQIKTVPNNPDTLLFVEGSGQVTAISNTGTTIPRDGFVFAENPGIDNDLAVDIETASINLKTVVEIVREVLDAFANEDISTIMKHISSDYKDRQGNTAETLERSLQTYFNYYEIATFTESFGNNTFTITTSGDTVNANVLIDFAGYTPTISFTLPEVDTSTQAAEISGTFLFNDLPFDQSIRLRDVSDGRSWTIELWDIRDFGRSIDDLITSDDVEFEDITYLRTQTNNRRLGYYQPRSRGIDKPQSYFIDKNEDDPLEPIGLLAIFQENALRRDVAPPILELAAYFGSLTFALENDINISFDVDENGVQKITSLVLVNVLFENPDIDLSLDEEDPDPAISNLDGQTSNENMGFSFSDGGPVTALFPGEADIVLQGAELVPTNPAGGVMMLPEGTDIFAVNPQVLINNLNRAQVIGNQFDPNSGNTAFPGLSATATGGRSYLVLNADGRTFALVSLFQLVGGDGDGDQFLFEYRYEDTFILPAGF